MKSTVYLYICNQLQGLPQIALFFSTLLLDLNLLKYWWLITHSLPRHGRFCYLTETLIKSQCSAQQSHPKVRCQNQEYFNLHDFTRKQITKIRLNEIQTWLKLHQGQFWKPQNMRSSLNNNIYLLKLKIWSKCSEKVQVFSFILTKILLISLFLTSDFRRVCWILHWLLVIVSVRYQNRPCLGREWVIDHQYLRRFWCNNRALQNNAFYGKRCISIHKKYAY